MEIKDVRKTREALRMTQSELAKASGVSQSMIARIERGSVDPSYSRMQRLISALGNAKRIASTFTAKDIMSAKIVTVGIQEKLSRAASLMKRKGISQLPVKEVGKIVGIVSERELATFAGRDVSRLSVRDAMSEAPPIIGPATGIQIISRLLEYSPCLLVAEKGDVKGIISRADILKAIS